MDPNEVIFNHPLSEFDTLMRKPFWQKKGESTYYDYETDRQGYVPAPEYDDIKPSLQETKK